MALLNLCLSDHQLQSFIEIFLASIKDCVREKVANTVDIDVNLGFTPVVIAEVIAWMTQITLQQEVIY